MTGVYVTFQYDGDFDRSRVAQVAQNARSMFEGMPGLRFKFFTFDEKEQRAVNSMCGNRTTRLKGSLPRNFERG